MSDQASGRASRWAVLYLRNHEAAASAGADLFGRMSASQRRRAWGPELVALGAEVEEDLRTLRGLLRSLGVRPDPLSSLALRAGERVGRLKPNGRLVRRSPLSDLVEVEAGLDALHAKAAGWAALRVAPGLVVTAELDTLERRVEDQVARMQTVHATVAAAVL